MIIKYNFGGLLCYRFGSGLPIPCLPALLQFRGRQVFLF